MSASAEILFCLSVNVIMKFIICILLICQSFQLSAQVNKILERKWSRECNDSISNGGYWDKDPFFFTYIVFRKHGELYYNNMCNFVRQLSTYPASPRYIKYKVKKCALFFYTEGDSAFKYKFSVTKEKDTLYKHKDEIALYARYSLLLITPYNNRYLFESMELKKINGISARKILRRNRKREKNSSQN
jgi:hypothetical protein